MTADGYFFILIHILYSGSRSDPVHTLLIWIPDRAILRVKAQVYAVEAFVAYRRLGWREAVQDKFSQVFPIGLIIAIDDSSIYDSSI